MMQTLLSYCLPGVLAIGGISILVAVVMALKIKAADAGTARMKEIAGAIEEGAKAYLNRQLMTISLIAVVIFIVVGLTRSWLTGAGFVAGAACSLAAGYIGMRVAVLANVRTAQAASIGRAGALRMAFNGGAVTGLLVVGLALVSLGIFFWVAMAMTQSLQETVSALVGVALGSSLISVFARLGGGIYTKAADVGADLVGKIEQNLDEDDPRNPATIADNVGDNVGDCAGMAADVFETYAVSIIGALLIGSVVTTIGLVPVTHVGPSLIPGMAAEAIKMTATTVGGEVMQDNVGGPAPIARAALIAYPFLISGAAVLAAFLGVFSINLMSASAPSKALMAGVGISAAVAAVLFYPITLALFPGAVMNIYLSAIVGLVMTGLVVLITNYYTATDYQPVRRLAAACETGHATNIIAGLALGQRATAMPVIAIGSAILISYSLAGLYGIAIAVVSMLSLSGIIISLDAFGPITDNAGGVAVMSECPKGVRKITDELDAVGNTMKAVTKGYAIASAGLAALVLFGSYVQELNLYNVSTVDLGFSLTEPKVIIGLFIGGLLPFLFTANTMDAVGKTAGAVVLEVRRQIAARPGILTGTEVPEYGRCVDIVTKAALREMIWPALMPIVFVLVVAAVPFLGPVVLGGVLVGTIVTGLFVGIAMTSSGGAWDNAKKYIEEGAHGGKGSPAHAAAVTGDTVGDPYKDTSGPAVNPMIKVVNIVAILVVPIFAAYWKARMGGGTG